MNSDALTILLRAAARQAIDEGLVGSDTDGNGGLSLPFAILAERAFFAVLQDRKAE